MIKELMIKGMDKVMLNCEEATFLITKSEVEKLGCIKKIQLKMHLAGCSFCRRFKLQSDIINKSLESLENIKNYNEHHHLPAEKKAELQNIIEKSL